MQPSLAQEPKATRTLDLARSRCAISASSSVRMPPSKRQTSISPSSMARTAERLPSMAAGQKTGSQRSVNSMSFMPRLSTATSQPPQAEAQYMASL